MGYSNLGYQLLGMICSSVGGKLYGDQLRERLFAPLGMESRIISEREIVPHRAAGYDRLGGQLANQEWVAPSLNRTADGSLYLTARDLARWSIALDEEKVLSRTSKEASWTPAKLSDGLLLGSGRHRFRVASENWSIIDFGAPIDEAETSLNTAKPLQLKGDDLVLKTQGAAYLFRLELHDPSSPVLSIHPLENAG